MSDKIPNPKKSNLCLMLNRLITDNNLISIKMKAWYPVDAKSNTGFYLLKPAEVCIEYSSPNIIVDGEDKYKKDEFFFTKEECLLYCLEQAELIKTNLINSHLNDIKRINYFIEGNTQ